MDKVKYRIQTKERKIKYAGTGDDSWFSLKDARLLVDYDNGERIIESDGVNVLWEVL